MGMEKLVCTTFLLFLFVAHLLPGLAGAQLPYFLTLLQVHLQKRHSQSSSRVGPLFSQSQLVPLASTSIPPNWLLPGVWPHITECPQQLKPGLTANCTRGHPCVPVCPEQAQPSHNRRTHTSHTEDTPGAPGSCDQRTALLGPTIILGDF